MPVSTTVVPSPLTNIHPNYLVSISGKDELGNDIGGFLPGTGPHHGIIAVLPEEFAINTSSMWAPLLNSMAQQIIGSALGGAFNTVGDVAKLAGISLAGTALTQLVWESTTPIEFRLPLTFNAVYDSQTEVMLPIMQLLSMTLPSSVGGDSVNTNVNNWLPLRAPGPNISGSSKYKVQITIGQAFTFSNIIIKSVNATFKTLTVQSGDFIAADVELEISTTRILTKSDLRGYFNRGNVGGIATLG
jgi:hypothetical protein